MKNESTIRLGFWTAAASLLLITGVMVWHLREFKNHAEAIQQKNRVLDTVQRVQANIQEAEMAQRNYVLTGDAYFLENYRGRIEALPDSLQRLRELVASSEQKDRIDELNEEVRRRMALISRSIALRRVEGQDAAVRHILDGRGIEAMAHIRHLIGEIRSEENARLALRGRRERRSYTFSLASILFGAFLSVCAVIVARSNVRREFRLREEAQRALRTAYGELERRVQRRTVDLGEATSHLESEIKEKNAIQARLEASNRELERFASIVSHDIQAPLRRVRLFSELLSKDPGLAGEAKSHADRINASVQRMTDLVNNLYQYAKASRVGDLIPINLADSVRDAIEDMEADVRDADADVRISALPTVKANPAFMRQLFQNLIGNALKYAGSLRPVVEVGCEPKKDAWEIYVRDNGPGLAARDQERIFQFFTRSDSVSRSPGTGIGLAVCKKIVETHGGRIWVDSEPGQGATFRFTLPAAASGVSAAGTETSAGRTVFMGSEIEDA